VTFELSMAKQNTCTFRRTHSVRTTRITRQLTSSNT